MPGRWGPDGPPPEAYSRLTNPERFAPVIDAADALVETLVATYDVTMTPVTLQHCYRAVRLQPREGAQLSLGATTHPGVHFTMGNWFFGAAPMCGCDACDETAETAIEQMLETIERVVQQGFRERLRRVPMRVEHSWGGGAGWMSVSTQRFAELAAVTSPGTYDWPPWALRS